MRIKESQMAKNRIIQFLRFRVEKKDLMFESMVVSLLDPGKKRIIKMHETTTGKIKMIKGARIPSIAEIVVKIIPSINVSTI